MRRVTLSAPAKLNLHLGIYSQLDHRRYHRADSLMVALDLCDEVTVEELPAGSSGGDAPGGNVWGDAPGGGAPGGDVPQLVCTPPVDVPAHKNTAYRAAVALAERLGRVPAVRISLTKRVPDQAGMGGSSSDAASVLRALCELWGVPVADKLVEDAARSVGADVPFFLDPVPTLLVGAGDVAGEKFTALEEPISVVLVRPTGPGVSTPAAYAAFDESPTEPASPDELCAVLRGGHVRASDVAAHLYNNLDPVACRLLPAVQEARAWLLAQDDVLGGQVTGSGSCVFGICASDESAEAVAHAARERLSAWSCAAHIV